MNGEETCDFEELRFVTEKENDRFSVVFSLTHCQKLKHRWSPYVLLVTVSAAFLILLSPASVKSTYAGGLSESQLIDDCKIRMQEEKCTILISTASYDGTLLFEIYLSRAQARKKSGNALGSIEDLYKALETAPTKKEINFEIGMLNLQNGNLEGAVSNFSEFLKYHPESGDGLYNRGVAFRAMGRCDRAVADFSLVAKTENLYDEAQYAKGLCSYETGNVDQAISSYNLSIEQNRMSLNSYFNRGAAYLYKGMTKEALEDFIRTLEIDKKYAPAHYNIGVVYLAMNRLDMASEQFTKALQFDEGYIEAYYNRGLIRFNQGDSERAINDLNAVIRLSPQSIRGDGDILYDFSGKSFGEKSNGSLSLLASSYLVRGKALHRLGKFDEALRDYRTVLAQYPDFEEATYLSGVARRLQRYEE